MKQLIISACLAILLAPVASAATWTFDNTTFTRETLSFADPFNPTIISESGFITGSFDYDAADNVYSNISVSVALSSSGAPLVNTFSLAAPINDPGLVVGPITYTPSSATQAYFRRTPSPSSFGTLFVTFVFADPLTEAGGTVDLLALRQDNCDIPTCSTVAGLSNSSFSITGDVTSPGSPPTVVPLPATLPLLFAGLGVMSILRRRNSRKVGY
ncbi:MAG: VPLPA-CTERM sorting domain-containing protein [Pseudomonadota bacterium]